MNTNERLTKEELEYLIERLELSGEEFVDNSDTALNNSPVAQGALQADLKLRLMRGVTEMRARNEEVPEHLLDLIERL
jgi:hypothetical protein